MFILPFSALKCATVDSVGAQRCSSLPSSREAPAANDVTQHRSIFRQRIALEVRVLKTTTNTNTKTHPNQTNTHNTMSNEPSNTPAQGTAASSVPSKKKHFIPLGTPT